MKRLLLLLLSLTVGNSLYAVTAVDLTNNAAADAPLIQESNDRADGVNVRLSSPHAARYLTAAREAAAHHQPDHAFDANGWASFGDHNSIDKAHDLGLDRLILSSLARLDHHSPAPPVVAAARSSAER